METDRIKWNKRFLSEDSFLGTTPSPFLARKIEDIYGLSPGKRALDIACGEGRNSIFLAQKGFDVTGVDISDVGLAKAQQRADDAGVRVDLRLADLENYRICEEYDLIINFNFLLRDLIYEAYSALSRGGVFIVDSILESPEVLVDHTRDYLLKHGELERIFTGFAGEILFLEEVVEKPMPTARVLFRKN